MILYIAEKPSLGRAIADVLPRPHKRGDGFIQVGNGDTVSWCIGHLLEQAEPDSYDAALKTWSLDHLPILPDQWQLKPKAKTRKQLGVLRKLVKKADQLVHAGDPDREGQLLVDEVIEYLGVSISKRNSTQRLLISDLNPRAVSRALANLRENRDFIPLSVSALARSRADWLYGINLTRAYTLQGRKVGYQGVLSVGRVQTPVLGLVVKRDAEISEFVSKPYYEVWAEVETTQGQRFKAKWVPSEECAPYQDETGRVLSRNLAENVVQRITGCPALVTDVQKKLKREAPPLPFNLSALQIAAANRYSLSAQQVLDVSQSLYERHKLITYPRSDSRHLPVEHHNDAPAVIRAIQSYSEGLKDSPLKVAVEGADSRIKSKAWNDGKVDAHHAIIPTRKPGNPDRLSLREQQIYQLIARQYLGQFFGPFEYYETLIDLKISGGRFVAKARQVRELGFKVIFEKEEKSTGNSPGATSKSASDKDESDNATLPPLKEGQELKCVAGELKEKQTQAPRPFTDATLLAAMIGIARFVENPQIRKILKETDGLGTEATRAGIIELLFKRGFLSREGKNIRSTNAGRGLIASLPPESRSPDMTAKWEAILDAISQRQASYERFMEPMIASLRELINSAKQNLPEDLKGVKATTPYRHRRAAKSGKRKTQVRKSR